MDFERARKQDVGGRVYEALEKVREAQARLNAAVTFVDPKEQLKELEAIGADATVYGTPVVLKDSMNMKGIRTTASSHILGNCIPVYNAHIVGKLQATGAVVITKASIDKLGVGGTNRSTCTEPVNNAWDESRISGGGSGGSAALVATGVVPFAVGTNTGDSVRKSAAYQGIVDTEPAYGKISHCGIIPYASGLDHVGYFTTSVRDTAVTPEVLAGRDDRGMTSSNRTVEAYTANLNHDLCGERVVVLDNVQEAVADPVIHENFDTSMKRLEARGATVTRVHVDDKLMKALMSIYYIIASAETTANHSNLGGIHLSMREAGENVEDVMINTRIKGFYSCVHKRFVVGSYSLFVENQDKIFRKAQKVYRLIVEELNRALANSDVVIASAAGTIVSLAEESKDSYLRASNSVAENHMVLDNLSGYPGTTMSIGSAEDMPIGINMTTKTFDEQTLFNIGLAVEKETELKGSNVEVDA